MTSNLLSSPGILDPKLSDPGEVKPLSISFHLMCLWMRPQAQLTPPVNQTEIFSATDSTISINYKKNCVTIDSLTPKPELKEKEKSLEQKEKILKISINFSLFSLIFFIGLSIFNVYHWIIWIPVDISILGVLISNTMQLILIDEMKKN